MRYAKYKFSCRLEDDTILPSFKGSILRGIFGKALRDVACTLKHQACDTCLLNSVCLYATVFESFGKTRISNTTRNILPPPFVLEPPFTANGVFKAGDAFSFNLMLFGEVNEKLPYFIYAFHRMGENGIGRVVEGKRSRFFLDSVSHNKEQIYLNGNPKVRVPSNIDDLKLNMPAKYISGSPGRLKICFDSPLRIKFQNHLTDELPFHVLVRSMLRRVSSLLETYDNGEPDINYKGIVQKATEVKTIQSNLVWLDARRYSSRQKRAMQLGGVSGEILYEGGINPFLPLIRFCEKVHVGKQTTFGLGKIRMEA